MACGLRGQLDLINLLLKESNSITNSAPHGMRSNSPIWFNKVDFGHVSHSLWISWLKKKNHFLYYNFFLVK